ncbi:hypothetical protein [Mycobacterium ulcerans]|nr:hypothetical protein [Mycobacterium ulcerans]MEB4416762.1 hypothetical protein [Mycobacterium ulcerans]
MSIGASSSLAAGVSLLATAANAERTASRDHAVRTAAARTPSGRMLM